MWYKVIQGSNTGSITKKKKLIKAEKKESNIQSITHTKWRKKVKGFALGLLQTTKKGKQYPFGYHQPPQQLLTCCCDLTTEKKKN